MNKLVDTESIGAPLHVFVQSLTGLQPDFVKSTCVHAIQ